MSRSAASSTRGVISCRFREYRFPSLSIRELTVGTEGWVCGNLMSSIAAYRVDPFSGSAPLGSMIDATSITRGLYSLATGV